MGLIEEEISDPLITGGRPGRRNNTKPIRLGRSPEAQKSSIRRSPEVMVKISGFTKGGDHLKAHMAYISRKGKVEIEDEEGAIFSDERSIRDLGKQWQKEIDEGNPPKANRRDAVRIVLSMPPGTDPMALKRAVRKFAQETFENHAYVFALHTDEKHPHVHLTVQMRGFDGERLNPRKKDLQEWRESFAACLLNQGVDCVATPWSSRERQPKKEKANARDDSLNL